MTRKSKTRNWQKPRDESALPEIVLGPDEHRVILEAMEALARDPGIFVSAQRLVEPIFVDVPPESIVRTPDFVISPIMPGRLRYKLSERAIFVRVEENDGEVKTIRMHPPGWCVAGVHSQAAWPGIPPLEGIVRVPVLLVGGRVLQTPGYDRRSGLLYVPSSSFPTIPDAPTHEEALAATELLLGVVRDFPLESPEHRAAWLAALLTVFGRYAYTGPSPLFLFLANVRGAGKGLLASIIATIATGRDVARTSMPESEDEMRKCITSIALAKRRLVLLDNLEAIHSKSLDAAITATEWEDRLLGSSRMTGELR